MADKKDRGFLTNVFIGAVKLATVGIAAAVAWQLFLDPIFLPIFHNASNPYAMAWLDMIGNNFSWIPQHLGLTPEPGFLSGIFDSFLAPEIAAAKAKLTTGDYIPPTSSSSVSTPATDTPAADSSGLGFLEPLGGLGGFN